MRLPRPSTLSRVLFALCVTASALRAQDTTSAITGVITGPNNFPIAGARVSVTGGKGGAAATVQSGANGRYVIRPFSAGGPYVVTVRAIGFQPKAQDSVIVKEGQRTTVDLGIVPNGALVLDQMTVVGSRAAPRTSLTSLAPVDVVTREAIEQTGQAELVETLASLIPSFNVQTLPALDAAIFVRPARLRNLSPDQTLVLLNGKRMHRSAMMMNPSYGSAFQAPDLDQVANSAIRSIDVLRDGAAAQYGSDAIAGVINLNLDNSPGFRTFAQYGRQFAGDGAGPRLGAHAGFAFDKGFIAVTGEYSKNGYTSRAVQGTNAASSQAAYPSVSFPSPAVHWGKPDREATRLALTAGRDVGSVSLYTFGTYGVGTTVGDFNYRGPAGSYASVFKTSAVFPGWNMLSVFPAGFTPHFGNHDSDHTLVVGAKTERASGLKLDVSVGTGNNTMKYYMTNSINASLGPNSPTSFDDGSVEQTEFTANVDGSLPLRVSADAGAGALSFGAEHRTERFAIIAGDLASYTFGPGAYGSPVLPCCSSGFPGYAPINAGVHQQGSQAVYADLDVPVNTQWTVGAAVRFEHSSNYGQSLTYKGATRLALTPHVAVRATVSTGFRAPTTAQVYSEQLSQFLPSATASITTTGRFSPVGPVAALLNKRSGVSITPLEPETSKNFSAGLVWESGVGLQVTLDAYQIDIAHRLNTSTSYVLTPAENAALTALHIPNVQDIYSANFLQNDYSTRNRGVDLVSVYSTKTIADGVLTLTAALSSLNSKITAGRATLNPYSKRMTEEALPRQRATVSAEYKLGAVALTARARHYGAWSDWTDAFPASAAPGTTYPAYSPQVFKAMTFYDLVANYKLRKNVDLKIGAENVLSTYPDKSRNQAFRGLVYSRNSPYSTDGGYLYTRIDMRR
ncbi:MAG: TonB-dependent receptor [Gemmatimonadetes bacterium]|nr:TonB-dependent receptor [Gemmatimonadota bacterium]